MWDLNYNDLYSLYEIGSTSSMYGWWTRSEIQRHLLDLLDGTIDGQKRNRTESRKHIRKMRRIRAISVQIYSLLAGVPVNKRHSFTREELTELHRIRYNRVRYDYWPISKTVTRRLRGLVKKQNGRRIAVSLKDFLANMSYLLNETEV